MFSYKNTFGKKMEFYDIHEMHRDSVREAVNCHGMAIFELSRHDDDGKKTWFFHGDLKTIKFLAKEWKAELKRVREI